MKGVLKLNPILFSGFFYIIAGIYGICLTIILSSNLIPLYLLHILTLITGFQVLKRRKWAAGLALFLFPLMFIFSISTLWWYLEWGFSPNLVLVMALLDLTLILYTIFTFISTFLVLISWKEFI
ncbi:MAG: hypothetical protein QXL69_03345 [Candidatus Bathyarchaeia archaeon]|nr:hypothetical protein [Candidatus Bathyarchaeota archaeon]